MEHFTKINDTEVEIAVTTTTVEKTVLSLDYLIYDRDSLVRNMAENIADAEAKNVIIQGMIDDLDAKIAKFKSLGAKMESELPTVTPKVP